MKVAILSVQGAFAEHKKMLDSLGVSCIQLRKKSDLDQSFDGLVLPGGESTVQGKLLKELDMFDPLQSIIKEGLPVLATCAGLILLAAHISNDKKTYFQTLPVTVKRNAYGRQLGSFSTKACVKGLGAFPMRFIRAPYIETVQKDVSILSRVDGQIVAVKYGKQIGLSFHPELSNDTRMHEMFLNML